MLVGYPPEDLVAAAGAGRRQRRPRFSELRARERGRRARAWSSRCRGPATAACTTPWRSSPTAARELRFKHELPNYGVFDEKRVFTPGPLPEPVVFRNVRARPADLRGHLVPGLRARIWREAGAQLLLVPNGSPFEVEKFDQRLDLARHRVSESGLPLAYVNQVGGQDELVFDGGSFVDERRRLARALAAVLARGADDLAVELP